MNVVVPLSLCAALLLPAAVIYQTTPPAPAQVPASASAPASASGPTPTGLFGSWRTLGGAVVATEPCPSGLCLRVITLSPNAPGDHDQNNPNPSLRTRPICKLEIGEGFTPAGDHANGGHIYDPLSGKTYKATLKLSSPDTLALRGYIGFSMIGRTETWHRTPVTSPCS